MYGRLTHLDLNCSPYEDCINCCSFNELSSLVAVSVGNGSVYLWDVQTHTDSVSNQKHQYVNFSDLFKPIRG